jgi:phytoene synthase
MRGSAAAVGVMMCHILCDPLDPQCLPYAIALGEAMQMTNFLRDIGEDARRGRIYLPNEDLKRFGLEERVIFEGKVTERFTAMMKFEIERTRALYAVAANGFNHLPTSSRKAVRLAALLYERILNRIESNQYDVFNRRARTSKLEKLFVGAAVLRN